MSALRDSFDERLEEVNAYLDFLTTMETQAQAGAPRLHGASQSITPQQQKLLYASLYLQLYSLVESTMSRCIETVARAMSDGSKWKPGDLTGPLRQEWVRTLARTHADLNYDNRLAVTVALTDALLAGLPVAPFEIEKGGGGNWDDQAIEKFSDRLGCDLSVPADVAKSVKRHVKDDQGPMALVKAMRNGLAHGDISFTESGAHVSVADLKNLAGVVIAYLGEVVDSFVSFVDDHGFLDPSSRPESA